jgi:hypothetical protein
MGDTFDFWIILLCYAALFANVYLAIKIAKRHDISIYLRFIIFFTVVFWNFPMLARPIVAWGVPDKAFLVDDDVFFEGNLLELGATAVLLQCYLWASGRRPSKCHSGPISITRSGDFLPLLIAAVSVAVCLVVAPSTMGDYQTANAGATQYSTVGQAESLVLTTVFAIICVLAILATSTSLTTSHGTLLFRIFGWSVIIIYASAAFFSGSRAAALLPAIVYMINQFLLRQSRRWVRIVTMFFLLAVTAPFTVVTMGTVRSIINYTQQDIGAAVDSMWEKSIAESALSVLVEVHDKTDSLSTARFFLSKDLPGSGGLQPVLSSFFAFIPRIVWPDKPVPGSQDGTPGGIPPRLAGMYMGGGDAFWVGLSPCHVTIWQFGYVFGVIVFVISNLIYLKVLNRLLMSHSLWPRALALFTMVPPLFHQTITTPDLVVQGIVRLGLLLAPFTIWYFVFRNTKLDHFHKYANASR